MTKPDEAGRAQAENAPHLSREENSLRQPDACGRFEARQDAEGATETSAPAESDTPKGTPPLHLFDLHCHLDFAKNAQGLAAELARRGIGALSATVTPAGYVNAKAQFADCPNVHTALGMHPWWVADGRCNEDDVAQFERLVKEARFIGEVGLDFAPAHVASRDAQLAAFERMARACAEYGANSGSDGSGGRLLTLHAVRSASTVMDVLERTGCTRTCTCVFHWFSGTSDELQCAIKLGFFFSINPRMLATKRGRAYVRAIPADRLLLETDLPSESAARCDAADLEAPLRRTLADLAALRDEDPEALGARIAFASKRVLQA